MLRSPNLPTKPKYGSEVYDLKFQDKKVMDNFHKLLEDAIKSRTWCKPIMTESRKQAELMQQNQISTSAAGGLGAIIKHNENKQEQSKNMIQDAFQDLESLKERSRKMVAIAEKIKQSVAKLEAQGEDQSNNDEIKQI